MDMLTSCSENGKGLKLKLKSITFQVHYFGIHWKINYVSTNLFSISFKIFFT